MLKIFGNFLSSSSYIPHGHCYLWQTPLVGLHLVSDALIAIAYFSIPALLIYFVRKRSDVPFSNVFGLFGAFIVLCGAGHLLDIWTLWHPDYWLSGVERAITALVSCYTALRLVELLPQFLALQTPEHLEAVNRELEKQVKERQQAEETLRMIVAGTSSVTGNDFFPALAENLAAGLDVAYVLVCQTVDDSLQRLRTIALWSGNQLAENIEYDLSDSPCKVALMTRSLCSYPDQLQQRFPNMPLLRELGVESYVGVPLLDADQKPIGHLCILDVKPFVIDDRTRAFFSVFAARAATELQRKWAEDERRRAYEDLEFRVEKRTCELMATNAALETEIQERIAAEAALRIMAEREQTITRIILQMRQSLKLESIFKATTAELLQAIACDRVLIYRFKPDWSGELVAESVAQGWMPLLSKQGSDLQLTRVAVNQPNCVTTHLSSSDAVICDTHLQETQGGIYRQRRSYCCVDDVYAAGFDACYLQLLEQLQARAYIIAPIFCGSQLWGLLATYQNGSSRQWQDADVRIATQVSNQLGVAVQQAELFAQTQHQAEELKQAKEAADAASRAKTEFLANMSHELRTPLNAILGFTQLMQRDASLTPDHQRYIEIINHSGEHLLDLINDVLEMSKIEAGRATLHEAEFDLYQLLKSLEAMLQLNAQSKGLQLRFDCEATTPQYIKTDANKLRQVLINLLGNAIKFTEHGSVTLRVRGQGAGEREQEIGHRGQVSFIPASMLSTILFEIEDTGPGIAAEEISDLFKPFRQTQSGQKLVEGTGLGLRISQTFVQLMGGEITVCSELGKGSCFTFQIRVGLAGAVSTPSPKINSVIQTTPEQSRHRILIAEDDPASRLLLSKLLSRLGFDVQEVENGQAAIDRWQQWQPHLIFMDMSMPVVNGYKATRQIREQEQRSQQSSHSPHCTTIIALTASAFAEQRQKSLAAGCNDFMSKPFRRERLLETISKHLGMQHLHEISSTGASQFPEGVVARSSSSLNAAALTIMPLDWMAQLHHTAAQGNDVESLRLIAQIPREHASLIAELTRLVESYHFDQLMTLAQAANLERA